MTQGSTEDYLEGIAKAISGEKKIIGEISGLVESLGKKGQGENKMALKQIESLKKILARENENALRLLEKVSVSVPMSKSPLPSQVSKEFSQEPMEKKQEMNSQGIVGSFLRGGLHSYKNIKLKGSEKETLKRLKKSEKKIEVKKEKKPNFYISSSNKIFSEVSASLLERGMFKGISINLIKSNMEFLPKSYVSVILFTTVISFAFSLFLFAFFLFFSVQASLPFVVLTQTPLLQRMVSLIWIILVVPAVAFLFMYFYPSLEKGSLERKIDQELPFAAINMAAISGSMIDPTKLFEIIISTREYPALEREFGKIINGVNVLGYDLISVLRNSAFTTPSKNLADLFNGIATTINTGGDLPKFFDERAKTLLFEYNLEKEKSTKAAETFMDIYISVVIAAPMILMLLLIIMQVSGLGFSLTTTMITLVMVLGVSLINVVFLAFLHIRQSGEA